MKVKVDNKMYDSTNSPIMVILEDRDKENIANMGQLPLPKGRGLNREV